MGLSRSTYYDAPTVKAGDGEIVAAMTTICDEFEAYGYRRVGAELRHRGLVVNSKKVRRLMREHDLQPKRHRRFVATTDSDHDYPIFPDLTRDKIVEGPNQLWVADITYIGIATGFVYLAAVLDAWSRRVIGYAICRSIDARVAVTALKAEGYCRATSYSSRISPGSTSGSSTTTATRPFWQCKRANRATARSRKHLPRGTKNNDLLSCNARR